MPAASEQERLRIIDRLRGRRARSLKRRLVDLACERHGARSLADLGGCWAVDGAYLLHGVERHRLERAVMVDTHPTPGFEAKLEEHANLELVHGNFGSIETADRVGEVDAVMLFDVLLHQVDPDWDEVLGMYAERARMLLVFNQQWTAGNETIRLLELGREEYLRNVPEKDVHEYALERLDETHPDHARPWRDVHHIWQWGIVDADLLARMEELGFSLEFEADAGPFLALPNFVNRAFLFVRAAQ